MSATEQLAESLNIPDASVQHNSVLQGELFHVQVDTETVTNNKFIDIGYMEGVDKPVAKFYLNGILEHFVHTYNNNMPDTAEEVDDIFQDMFQQLYDLVYAMVTVRGSQTEWISDEENAHDSAVVSSVVAGYKRLKELNTNKPQYKMTNVMSYLLENNMQSFYDINHTLASIGRIEHDFRAMPNPTDDTLDEYADQLKTYLTEITTLRSRVIALLDEHKMYNTATQVCMYCINKNASVSYLQATETEVILQIWNRIHASDNADVQQQLLTAFTQKMAELTNPNKEDGVECVSGRVSYLLSALETIDVADFIDIKSVPAYKTIITARAFKLINEELTNMEDDVAMRYSNGELTAEETAQYRKLLYNALYSEFNTVVVDVYLKKIINDVNDQIFG